MRWTSGRGLLYSSRTSPCGGTVDAADSKSAAARRGSSNLPGGTSLPAPRLARLPDPGAKPETETLDRLPDARAMTQAAGPGLAGSLGGFVAHRRIMGWAADPARPGEPVRLVLMLRGAAVQRLSTGAHDRPDLFEEVGSTQGFLADLPAGYLPGDLATGRLTLHPLDARGEPMAALPLSPQLLAQEQTAAGHAMLVRAEEALGRTGLAAMLALLGRPEGFGAAQRASEANGTLHAGIPGQRPGQVALSSLAFPVGLRSAGGGVVLGHDGHLFLLAGSNGEIARLGAEPSQRARLVEAWLALIAARKARAEALGIRYLQLIVPEKTSLVPDLLPDPAPGETPEDGPSPLLAAFEDALAARAELADCTVSGLLALEAAANGRRASLTHLVRRLDTHPSPAGMHVLARAVLTRLGESPPDLGPRFVRPRLGKGDLSVHFLPEPCYEEVLHAPARAFERFGAEPQPVAQHRPPDGRHIGRREHWRAPGAPSPRRILVCGNSICDSPEARQPVLSGWLARWFAEYHFHWRPDVDWEEVAALRPDILLCQTVERFMGQVPAA